MVLDGMAGTVAKDVGEQVAKNEQAAVANELLNSMTNDVTEPQVAGNENQAAKSGAGNDSGVEAAA